MLGCDGSNVLLKPLVTIAMPIRDGLPFLKTAIKNVLEQDYPNIEIIISNNCSNKEVTVFLQKVKKTNNNIKLYEQKELLSAFENFGWLVGRSEGKYFLWAAHDDLRPKDYVSKLVSKLETTPRAVLAFPTLYVSDTFGKNYQLKEFNFENHNCNILQRMRKSAINQCYHIYGVWRTDALKKIPFIYNPWWPDTPIMMVASLFGTFVFEETTKFQYYEIIKSNRERRKYQDIVPVSNKILRIFLLIKAVFTSIKKSSGLCFAIVAVIFLLEKIFRTALVYFRIQCLVKK